MVCPPSIVEIWTYPTRLLDIPFPRWSTSSRLTSVSRCHTPRGNNSHRALASRQLPVHNSKRPCGERNTWRGRVTAAQVCETDSRKESQKRSPVDHPIAHAPVILSSSDHSTVPRSPQTRKCDRGSNWQVPRTIVLPSLWWDVWLGESSPSFLR